MTKADLIRQITDQLEQELATLLHASAQAHQSATHSESRAENKYDTLGLEAAYLAHGLSVRAQELQQAIAAFRRWIPASFGIDEAIAPGALVTLENQDGLVKRVLLAAQGGGLKGSTADGEVTLVTLTTPLGKALRDKRLDDEVVLEIQGQRIIYCVIDLE